MFSFCKTILHLFSKTSYLIAWRDFLLYDVNTYVSHCVSEWVCSLDYWKRLKKLQLTKRFNSQIHVNKFEKNIHSIYWSFWRRNFNKM